MTMRRPDERRWILACADAGGEAAESQRDQHKKGGDECAVFHGFS